MTLRSSRGLLWSLMGVAFLFSPIAHLSHAAGINATLSDTLSVDNDSDGIADPGDRIRYQATITNIGSTNVNGMIFTATADSNTTFLSGTVKVSPIAFDDSYSMIGNTVLEVPANEGLLVNDYDPDDPTLSAVFVSDYQSATTANGSVSVETDGSFTYTPPVGFRGTDTFDYEITDLDSLSATGTVSVVINDFVWFVNNASASGGNGTMAAPFDTLVSAQNASAINDFIFVYFGTGTSTGLNSGIALKSGQKLIGQGINLVVGGKTLVTATSPPVLTRSSGTVVTLASNTTVRGITISNASATGIGASGLTGTIPVSNVTISGHTGDAISLSSSSAAFSFADVSVTTTAGRGLVASSAGSVTLTNSSVTSTGGAPYDINSTFCSITLPTLSSTSSTGKGLSLMNLTAGSVFQVTGTTTISNAAAESLYLASIVSSCTVSFNTINITNRRGQGIVLNSMSLSPTFGSTTINNPNNAAGEAILVSFCSTPVTFPSVSINNAQGNAIRINNCSAGTFQFNLNGGTISNCAQSALSIQSSKSITLDSVSINTTGSHAITGDSVTDFTMRNNCSIGAAGNWNGEHGINFTNLLGTVLLQDLIVDGMFESGIVVSNSSGTLSDMTLRRVTLRNNNATYGENGLLLSALGTANMTATVANCTFTNLGGDGINSGSEGTSSVLNLGVTATSFSSCGGRGIRVGANNTGQMTFNIASSNQMTNQGGSGVAAKCDLNATLTGTISGNTINGSTIGTGIDLWSDGNGASSPTMTINVSNNTISNTNAEGIFGTSEDGSGSLALTVHNNTVNAPTGTASGMSFVSQNTALVCANLTNNTSTGNGGAYGFDLAQLNSSTFQLPGFAGGAVSTYLSGKSNVGSVDAWGTFVNGTCNTP